MLKSNENEQLAVAYQRTLEQLGIAVSIRSVDAAQYPAAADQTTIST